MRLDAYALERAAAAIAGADALLVTAGAGMGVDSGLPDFRGDEGFWRAYPPLAQLGLSFVELANPSWFERDPSLAWAFYGHRLGLYRRTPPHAGYHLLRRWGASCQLGCFVFTSNVDGHFQRAGFLDERVVECHGSIHHLQCIVPCRDSIWPADDVEIAVDEVTFRAASELPGCPRCGRLARPNVLMFGDWSWVPSRTSAQEERFLSWMRQAAGSRLAIVELGAGTAVPTVRLTSERVARSHRATLIRINPRETQGPADQICLQADALDALNAIEELLHGAAGSRNGHRPEQ